MITSINEFKLIQENNDELMHDIYSFLTTYATISPNYDPEWDEEDEKYTGPDPTELLAVANTIKNNQPLFLPRSSWESGSYTPYNSNSAQSLHDSLLIRIKQLL